MKTFHIPSGGQRIKAGYEAVPSPQGNLTYSLSYSDQYEEKGVFERQMDQLRRITPRGQSYAPVMVPALR